MNLLQPLITNPQPPVTIEPTPRALNDPAMAAQSLTAVHPFASDSHFDPAPADCPATSRVIIAFVSVQLLRPLAGTPSRPLDRLNGVEHLGQHLRVVEIRRTQLHRERDALSLDHKMALRARFAAIRRIRPGRSAPLGAGTENESIQARLQSI